MTQYQEALFICIFVGTVTFVIPWLYRRYLYSRDSNRIVSFLRDSKYTFRSTEAIAKETGLVVARVEEVCSRHSQIIQNKKRPETWRVM